MSIYCFRLNFEISKLGYCILKLKLAVLLTSRITSAEVSFLLSFYSKWN